MASSSRPKSPLSDRDGDIRMGSLNNLSTSNLSSGPGSGVTPATRTDRHERDDDHGGKDSVKVDPYWGTDKDKLSPFLIQLKMVFKLKPNKYPEEEDKVMFAAMHLKGPAFAWFEPTMKDWVDSDEHDLETRKCFANFKEFELRIKKVFGAFADGRAAARTIYKIKQKGSAAMYYSEFQQVASKLNWEDEDAFAEIFYNGLKESVRKHMMDPPVKYKKMVDEAIKIDNRLYELRVENGEPDNQRYQRYQNIPRGGYQRPRSYGDPMDISAMHGKPPSKGNGFRGRGGGGRHGGKDRDRQMKENLCFNCGKPGHRARECNSPRNTLHMMVSDDIAGSGEIKADTPEKAQTMTGSQGISAREEHQEPEVYKKPGVSNEWDTDFLDKKRGKQKERSPPAATTALAEACQQQPISAAGLNCLDAAAQHAVLSWTACYDDACPIHLSDKDGSGWYPQRPRRKNRPDRKNMWTQESRNQEEGTPLYGRNLSNDEFWMMNQEEEVKFEVLSDRDGTVILRTHYWERKECDDRERPCEGNCVFNPEASKQILDRLIFLEDCDNKRCTVPGTHAHQLHGPTCPIERPQTSLQLMNQKEPEEVPLGRNDDPQERVSHTLDYDARIITVVTNRWSTVLCDIDECEPSQHQHVVYTPEGPARERLKKITMWFCWDPDCEDKENIHIHQCGEPDTIEIRMRKENLQKIRDWHDNLNNLSMMVQCVELHDVIDDRFNEEHMHEDFWCANTECKHYFTKHAHRCNIDPAHPYVAIGKQAYERMLNDGLICEQQNCVWRLYLHAHFPEHDLSMMVGSKYNPEIVENVVDERVEEDAIADYFVCVDNKCSESGNAHSHLLHIDPERPEAAMPAKLYNKLATCLDETCEFEDWKHTHWPKNL